MTSRYLLSYRFRWGEELTLPNALIIAKITRNYSRTVQGPGYILDATVTSGQSGHAGLE